MHENWINLNRANKWNLTISTIPDLWMINSIKLRYWIYWDDGCSKNAQSGDRNLSFQVIAFIRIQKHCSIHLCIRIDKIILPREMKMMSKSTTYFWWLLAHCSEPIILNRYQLTCFLHQHERCASFEHIFYMEWNYSLLECIL